MKGRLTEGLLPSLLRELYVGRETGLLSFSRMEERRGVRFRHGHLTGADTNVREERLGEVLVHHGKLSAADLKRATGFVLRDKKKLGVVLQELGILDKTGLEDAMGLHVREILSKVFDWKDGEYAFQPEEDIPPGPDDVVLKLSTAELILEAARSVEDPDVIRYCIGNLDRVVALSNDPLLRFQKLALTAVDGYVLSRIDGTISAREVQQIIPLQLDETLKSLFGLLSTGVIEFLPGPPKKKTAPPPLAAPPVRPAAPEPAAEPLVFVEAPATTPVPPPASGAPPLAAPSASEPRPRPVIPEPETDPRRLEVLEAHQGLKGKNHFEVLGLTRGATEAQVKEAYFRMAKRFHPDVHHSAGLSDLREQIESVFIRLGLAYEVLRNPRTRANYESELPRAASPAVQFSAPEAPPPPDPAAEAKVAEQSLRKAEKAMAEEKYWEAIQLLESALGRLEGKVRLKGRVLLAKAYAKNPNWVKQAEEELVSVLREDPAHLEACLLLGAIYRDGGLKARALSMYRKALDVAPENAEALSQASLLAASEPEPEKKGVFKKLFGRG